jgi:hypothetical protein
MTRPLPFLGDVSLDFVQRIEHSLDGGFAATRIANLPGELQQRSGRPSHRIAIAGLLFGEGAADQLSSLQTAAATGEELTFAADITTALDLQKVVITSFRAVEIAGTPSRFAYEVALAESPPLPPPAEVSGFGFGGLDDFGLGDLGFDTDILGDLADLADQVASAVNDALDVIDTLSALANLGDLGGIGGVFDPLNAPVEKVGQIASDLTNAIGNISEAFTS